MSIKITVDGKVYDDITTITVGGKVLTLTHVEDSGEPNTPTEPEVTLTSISATYSGGAVEAGTSVTALTGVKVTAHYSNGTSATVTGYTLSGTIAEGSNTITVKYSGKTTTFTVTGTAPAVVYYTITKELVNVTINNGSNGVVKDSSYTAKLTAADGYTLDSVTVTMGGVDVTSTVYADGLVNIAYVTGNVEIIASAVEEKQPELITDGLLDFFDFRNITTGKVANGGWGVTGTNGYLYSWASAVDNVTADDYGLLLNANLTYVGGTVEQNVTVCTLSYRADRYVNQFTWSTHMNPNNESAISVVPQYIDTSGATKKASFAGVNGCNTGYNVVVMSISPDALKVYTNGVLQHTRNASEIADFASWVNTITLQSGFGQSSGVAAAIYNRTLSQEEIVEIGEYFKTLEVE